MCKLLFFFFQQFKRCTSGGEIPSSFVGIEQLLFSPSSFLKLDFPKTHLLLPSSLYIRTDCGFLPYPQERRGIVSYFMATLRQPHSLHCLLVTAALYLPPSLIPCVFPLCSFDLVRLSPSPTAAH